MRVEITRVLDATTARVAFRCAVGQASGHWAGRAPAAPGEFDVELEIPEEIADWTVLGAPAAGSIVGDISGQAGVSITATVGGVGEGDDTVVELRLGSDILLVEAPARRWEVSPGEVVALHVPSVRLYPYDL
ncbi:hypothetical protein [Kitasatospora aureofaciens]|uniref:hypothetical protein n=1 Tax=Kitasatospora aureofaciens TaxID=1894 RepID=UPI001C46B7DA|nr:hypothetical protein [Kitasatospora aureofaciens]MBV6700200.1 hypothetical protein [Kitasatospora aureofaciens]